jgi:sugar lactone lactonase YvrE
VIGLLSAVLGPTRPFSGMTLAQLTVTMRALLSLLVLGICLVLLRRRCAGLGAAGWGRLVLASVVLVLAATTVRDALRASFSNQDYPTEFLMYADSSPDTALVMADLNKISSRLAGDRELKIAYDNESSWPYVWLLRDYHSTTFFTADSGLSGDPQVVIVGPPNEEKVQAQLKTKYIKRQYRLIWWPNQDIYAGMTPAKIWKDLRDPARRRYWWDIFWSRKYPQSTTSWPYVHPFSLYVRKDVAAQLWDFGPEIAGAEVELPEDVYEKKRQSLGAVSAFGSSGAGNGQFNDPKGVALDAAGNIYVMDTRNYRVQVLNSEGVFQRAWGSQGTGPGQFQEPWGIAVDTEGSVYVADTWNHRIQKFDSTGQFVKTWGTFGDVGGVLGDPLLLYGPRGIVVDSQNNVLVSDTGNKRIVKYTSNGEFVQQWGGSGSVESQFREPCGVAMDASDGVYVADVWNQRVQEFDRAGSFVAQWPVVGWESEAPVNKPYLAIGSQGSVYITQPDYHRLVKFNGGGQVLAMWGRFGTDDLGLNTPSGIAVDSAGFIYVADSGNNRIVKYAPVN